MFKGIIGNPGEYHPILLLLAAFAIFWAGLCWSGVASLRASTRRRRFWFANVPLAFGLIGVAAQIPFSMEGEEYRLSLDFRWFFFRPLLLGTVGLVLWSRTRKESVISSD